MCEPNHSGERTCAMPTGGRHSWVSSVHAGALECPGMVTTPLALVQPSQKSQVLTAPDHERLVDT